MELQALKQILIFGALCAAVLASVATRSHAYSYDPPQKGGLLMPAENSYRRVVGRGSSAKQGKQKSTTFSGGQYRKLHGDELARGPCLRRMCLCAARLMGQTHASERFAPIRRERP